MRLFIGSLAFLLTASLVAQVAARKDGRSTKDIMTSMTIPASNALFNVPEKPTQKEWGELRRQAAILSESGTLLSNPGQARGKGANPADWNKAAKALRDAVQMAIAAIDKKDAERLSLDVSEKILDSCSSCHEKYLPK